MVIDKALVGTSYGKRWNFGNGGNLKAQKQDYKEIMWQWSLTLVVVDPKKSRDIDYST